MGKRDEKGKQKGQQEAELFEESLSHPDDDSAELFSHLQEDFEAALDESASHKQTPADISPEEMQELVDDATHSHDKSLSGAKETAPTTHTGKTADDAQGKPLSAQTDAEEADKPQVQMKDGASSNMNEADEVDGYFVQFSELANSASQQQENTPDDADEDLFMNSDEDLFAGETPSPAPEQKPMIHPLSPPAGKHRAGRRIVAAALALVAVAGGTMYWLATPESDHQTTTDSHTPATTMTDSQLTPQEQAINAAAYPGEGVADSKKQKKQSPAERIAAAEKILADARAAKAKNVQATSATTETNAKQTANAPTTAEQIETAKAELAAEKKRLADAEAVADKIRQAKADALREEQRRAKAAAAVKQLAENKAAAARKTAGKPATGEKRPAAQQVVIREHQPISDHSVSKKMRTPGQRQNKVGQLVVEYGALDGGASTRPTAKPVTSPAVTPVHIDAAKAGKQTPAPSGQAGRWAVILTSASSDKSARQQRARMLELGVQAEIARVTNHGRVFHRIQITGFATRLQAQKQLDLVSRKLGLHGAKIEKL
ncbi:SPOR domain-containing protein [Mariprofundus ferrooxydans]|uniref:SPOR domain-containing protein n=1 Tax=Mariprofundus ferrooxydans PV-1 TaxID=314345 RepID=Q0F3I0_9PROT|nr:SPOR domain-containing protein [Mariprofundus ferrooxydans]EAU55961.1 hypothetical protein SPV1_04053 [Mariprofundus ferrooxydans PV-1]KON48235.1 hypothetical protein AL013_04155 [Mariprofundus ferrooxydans]